MKIIRWLKLLKVAYGYKNKYDIGGIAYLCSKLKKDQSVIDIGSHQGEYLYFMQKIVGRSGKVYSFEPQASLYAQLSQAKVSFGWNHVTVERLAISNETGQTTLFIPNATFDASIRKNLLTSVRYTEEVNSETLDSYCLRHQIQPNFIKIDVEGSEYNVIEGAMSTLKKYKPKLLIEIEARHVGEDKVQETFSVLQKLGYSASFIEWRKVKPLDEFSFAKHQNIKNLWISSEKTPYCNNFVFECKY